MELVEINKQLNKEFKLSVVNEDERLIAGWASVEVIDKQGQYVDVDTLAKAMLKFMDRGGFVNYGHENKPIGKVLQWEIRKHPNTGQLGVWIIAKINKGYKLDDIVWNLIKSGKLKGFSIAGLGNLEKRIMKSDDGQEREVEVLKDVELTEISIVDEPANPYALIEEVSVFAKGSVKEIMKTDYVQGLVDVLWERIDDILRKYNISKSQVIADEIADEVEKHFEEYVSYVQKFFKKEDDLEHVRDKGRLIATFDNKAEAESYAKEKGYEVFETKSGRWAVVEVQKAEGAITTETEGMMNPTYGDKVEKPKEKKKEDEEEDVEKKYVIRDLEGLERLEVVKSEGGYIVKDLKTGEEVKVFEKVLTEFKKPEDLRPPKEWWERCIEETGRPGLCGWVYYHHLKPEKPAGKKDKPHTRTARQRKKKWLKEKKSGEVKLKIEELRKTVKELKKALNIEGTVEIRKPFAGFKDWDDCIKKMKKQGYSEESAKRICGKLKAEYEKALIRKRMTKTKRILKGIEIKKKIKRLLKD